MNKAQVHPRQPISELLTLLQEDIFTDAPEYEATVTRVQEIVVELLSGQMVTET